MASVNLGKVVGDSAYEIAKQNGFIGTETEWLVSLKGDAGATGAKGDKGDTGDVREDAYDKINYVLTDLQYKSAVATCTSKHDVDILFAEWWNLHYDQTKMTKSEMLERWFGTVLDDNRVHGVKTPLFGTSTTAIGEYTDDSVGLTCEPSTASEAGQDDFAYLPQFWILEVSAEKNEDGSHEIFYVQHVDDIEDVRSGEHLCWVLQKNTYFKEWDEDGYRLLKMTSRWRDGWHQWPQGTDRTGKTYAYIGNPKYYAGIDADGEITCGTGFAPVNWTSHTTGLAKWRARGSQYSGTSGHLNLFLEHMMRLKYATKGNSGTIEGCSTYDKYYYATVSETDVARIILSKTDAANLFVGSAVQIGADGTASTDRNIATNYDICRNKKIVSIEDVTIGEVEYSAVTIDNDGETFATTASATRLFTDPYWSGWNDTVLGTDGSRYSCTTGKEPGLLQGIEFMNGSYLIISDQFLQWSKDDDDNYLFDCYVCENQNEVHGSSITADYVKQNDLTMMWPADTSASGVWEYIEDVAISDSVLWPLGTEAGGSGVGCKSAFNRAVASSGVRSAWCGGSLRYGGLACRNSNLSAGSANWNGSLGASGLAG